MFNQPYLREYAKYASLNVLGMMGLCFYIVGDTYFVAKGLGANGLAALNLAIPFFNFIRGIGLMLGIGGATQYVIHKNRHNLKLGNKIFTNSLYWGGFFALLFVAIGLFFADDITRILGADSAVYDMTYIYIKVLFLFAPAFILNDILICAVRNDGDPRRAMLGMLIGSVSNVLLDYIFIFPLQMGMFGAILATGLAPVISLIILSPHWLLKHNQVKLVASKIRWPKIKRTFSIGLPSLITESSSGIVIIVFNIIILHLLGNVGVAAYGVVANLSLIAVAIFTGLAQGIQPLVSGAYGKNNLEKIKIVLGYTLKTLILMSVAIYIFIYFGADFITHIFNSENNVQLQGIATNGLKLYFTAVFFVGFNIVMSIYFSAIASPRPAQIISLLRGLFLIVPMAFFLSNIWAMNGVWLSFPITEGLVALLSFILYRRSKVKITHK